MEVLVGDPRPAFVVIPTGIWHGVQNVGSVDALMVNVPTHDYDYEDPDHWRLAYDSPESPYTWRGGPVTRLRSDKDRQP